MKTRAPAAGSRQTRLWNARDLLRALAGELQLALDLLGGQLAQVLVDDVADMLEVGGEGDDLHGPAGPRARRGCLASAW